MTGRILHTGSTWRNTYPTLNSSYPNPEIARPRRRPLQFLGRPLTWTWHPPAPSLKRPPGSGVVSPRRPGRCVGWQKCRRFEVCVCVSTSVTKSFCFFLTVKSQGAHGSVPGVSQRSSRFRLGYRKRTLFRRTCAQLLIKLFFDLVAWWLLTILSPQTGFPPLPSAAVVQPRSADE